MENEGNGILSSLLVQFSAGIPLIWPLVEFASPKGNTGRRIALVLYSWLFSLVAWMLGVVTIPEMLPMFEGSTTAHIVVVLVLGLVTAALTHQAHQTTKTQALK